MLTSALYQMHFQGTSWNVYLDILFVESQENVCAFKSISPLLL